MKYIEILSIAYQMMEGEVEYGNIIKSYPDIKSDLDEILIDNDCPDIIVNI